MREQQGKGDDEVMGDDEGKMVWGGRGCIQDSAGWESIHARAAVSGMKDGM